MSEWISVKTRLPEINQRVIVWNGYAVFDLDYKMRPGNTFPCFYGPYDNKPSRREITHWMPLPEPPKD